MFQSIFCDLKINNDNQVLIEHHNEPEQDDIIPFDAIIPLIEAEWKDEERAYGEACDRLHSKLSMRAATLRRQQQRCSDPRRYEEIEKDLEEVEAKLCEIALRFEESVEYPE